MEIEETVVVTIDLPEGKDYEWFAEANVVGLSRRLDEAGRQQALCQMFQEWRRSHLRVVA